MSDKEINTNGGTVVEKNVETGGGEFIGRDKIKTTTIFYSGNAIVAIIAVLVAGVIGVMAVMQREKALIGANPSAVTDTPFQGEDDAACLTQFFADITPANQITIEVGVNAQDHYFSSQALANPDMIGPLGIRLTQNGNMIGALTFLFFPTSRLFKLTSLVDAHCQAVTEYSNFSRGGDPNALHDWDTLKLQVREGAFSLNFCFCGTDYFRFNFQQLR